VRWSTYRTSGGHAGADGVGVWQGERLHPVPGVSRLTELLGDDGSRLRAAAAAAIREPGLEQSDVELLAPVPSPPSIRDFMAFEEHVVTASAAIGLSVDPLWYQQPVFYFSNPAAVRGPQASVAIPPGSGALDYEIEVAAGRGYDVPLTVSVNGVAYSRGNLADLYWSFGEMLAYASRGTRLVPGDIIGSGTVGTGCILELSRVHGAAAYPYLRPGDQVRLDGGPLGAIEAAIAAGQPAVPLRPADAARPATAQQEAGR
jgi:2-keto-4-pentenoate hydratase/2-oxohepta-3-ene-1,7-dioic acid hydratase in catechol pathway